MSSNEHKQMVDRIERGLEIAEREMLEEKAKNNEDVIVCGDDNVIRHIPASNFLWVLVDDSSPTNLCNLSVICCIFAIGFRITAISK